FFHKAVIMYIIAHNFEAGACSFIYGRQLPGGIHYHQRRVRQFSFQFAPGGAPGLPFLLYVFDLDTVEKLVCFGAGRYIVAVAAHFKEQYFKWRSKNGIALVIAAAGAVYDAKPFISVSDNSCPAQYFTGYVFIQHTVYLPL